MIRRLLQGTTFGTQLALLISAGIGLLAIISSLIMAAASEDIVRNELVSQGEQVARSLASQSGLALLYESAENAEASLAATMEFPAVKGAAIYLANRDRLAFAGDDVAFSETIARGEKWEDSIAWYMSNRVVLNNETDSSPFVSDQVSPQSLGYVVVKVSKEPLQQAAQTIYVTNLLISAGVAILLIAIALYISRGMTRPVSQLATAMNRAREGEKNVRAAISGPIEIAQMDEAFNTMMETLEAREAELESARDIALESARIKGEFAANVSHEIRTPLNGVLGMLELLGNMGLTAKQDEHLEVARSSGEALLSLINDILDFSRIEARGMSLEHSAFDLRIMLDEVLDITGEAARVKDLDVAYVVESGLPNMIQGDPNRIRQILINLTANAIKFTAEGEVEISVRLQEGGADTSTLLFAVRDTGIGIEEHAQQRIFHSFEQADGTTTREYGGSGLGLAICRQLVDLIGGEIGVESRVGLGSRFWFTVPNTRVENDSPAAESNTSLRGLRLLVIDDCELISRSVSSMAARWGAIINHVANGVEALAMLHKAKESGLSFDVVLVDQNLPVMNGTKLVRMIRSEACFDELKIIFMVGQTRIGRAEMRMAGVSGYLNKPIKESRLAACIGAVLDIDPDRSSDQTATAQQIGTYFGRHILVVEDNRANQRVACGMLETLGCIVDVANHGEEAVEMVARSNYDLVFMDCQMPVMDGYEATKRIRKLEADGQAVPIVALTATVGTEEAARCTEVGMNDVLGKPIRSHGIEQKLSTWLVASPQAKTLGVAETNAAIYGGVLDVDLLQDLRETLGPGFFTMIEVYLEDMPGYFETLKTAIADSNFDLIRNTAHAIKGSSANLGAVTLVDHLRSIEQSAAARQIEGNDVLLSYVLEIYQDVHDELKGILQSDWQPKIDLAKHESRRILIADDDRAMRGALSSLLSADGYRVTEAENGTQIIKQVERTSPDLILMGGMMPEMDGFDVCQELRSRREFQTMPILLITALEDRESIERAFAVGATDYISKPVHFSVLSQRVRRLVDAGVAQRQAKHVTYHDSLTGLSNKAALLERLADVCNEKGTRRPASLLYINLDRFALVNDTHGHDLGDLLIKAVADRLAGCVRDRDLVARYGGDEFAIVLDDPVSGSGASAVAKKVLTRLESPFIFMDTEIYVTPSIGIARFPDDGQDTTTLMKLADAAMYRAKERGNSYCFYETGMESDAAKKLELDSGLRGAVGRGEFQLYYQPQIDTASNKVVGAEALVRWNHPKMGLVSPGDFIPLAEETGIINELGEWVLNEACEQLKRWLDKGYAPIQVAVNVSGRQLERGGLSEQVAALIRNAGIDPSLIELEITESAVMRHADKAIAELNKIHDSGVSLAIDDFGTGYSSLSYLRRFPIQKLKVDQAFVAALATSLKDESLVDGIIALAHSLSLKVTAEGVETSAQERILLRLGSDLLQGYLFSRPVPAGDFEAQFLGGHALDA